MSDVRLVGTSPEDGSLVPVAVTPSGLLKTEIGKIEKIPNDVEIEGNLTVTGTINGESGGGGDGGGGSGLPEPYGPEGSILSIENGEPAWTGVDLLCKDYVPPEPVPDAELVDNSAQPSANCGLYDASGQKISLAEGWDDYCRELAIWETPPASYTKQGLSVNGSGNLQFKLALGKTFGRVVRISVFAQYQLANSGGGNNASLNWYMTSNNENVVYVSGNSGVAGQPTGFYKFRQDWVFLCNRDVMEEVTFNYYVSSSSLSNLGGHSASVRRWEVEDSGTFAVQNQMRLQEELEALRASLSQ